MSLSKLKEILKQKANLNSIGALLSWDQEVYMPKKAIDVRSEQVGLLSKITHEKWTSEETKRIFESVIDPKTKALKNKQNKDEEIWIKKAFKDWEKATRLPASFVSKLAQTSSKAQHMWAEARKNNDFGQFSPYLEQMIELTKQKAEYINPKESVYNVCLDEFDEGITQKIIDPLFEQLKVKTIERLQKIQTDPDPGPLTGSFDKEIQWKYNLELLKLFDFPFDKARLDLSTHPFTIDMHPTDVRITTRVNQNNLFESISSTIHECGHAFYELGLNSDHFGNALGQSCSLSIHESQSRLWENVICKSDWFWKNNYAQLQEKFDDLKPLSFQAFYQKINRIKAGPIRVESDELTYNLHIILRYEIEKAIFDQNTPVNELPKLFNQKMNELLGITPKNDQEGILQDVHWSCGLFGYFPTYTLGNIIALQLFDQLKLKSPQIIDDLQLNKFESLKQWLTKNVHAKGRRLTSLDLLKSITGSTLTLVPFLKYLDSKVQTLK